MNVLILSTESKHHAYFINKLSERFNVVGVIYERRRVRKDYPTGPFLEQETDTYEERFFDPSQGGVPRELQETVAQRLVVVHSVNQPGMAEFVAALKPDIAITFGVGIVRPQIFTIPRWGTINVHRGFSHVYRGLDSDLWAILQNNFDCLGVTIHVVDEQLDTGDILAQERIRLGPEDRLRHLRYRTTVLATRLVILLLERAERTGRSPQGKKLKPVGDYYSAMPLDKKLQAMKNFSAHIDSLCHAK